MNKKRKNIIVRKMLNEYIEKYGTTKAHIARELGISRNTISQFTLGNRDISIELLQKITELILEK